MVANAEHQAEIILNMINVFVPRESCHEKTCVSHIYKIKV